MGRQVLVSQYHFKQSLFTILFGAGGLLGSLVSGWSWDSLGAELSFGLGSVFALLGWLLVVIWVRLEPPGSEQSPDGVMLAKVS